MLAVCKHELRMYFQTLTAYVFGAFLLVVVGIGAMLYNLQAAVSNFEYVLSFSSLVFAVIVPILTMRTLAEERRQRTDQLLYSLPISTLQVIIWRCWRFFWRRCASSPFTRWSLRSLAKCTCPQATGRCSRFSCWGRRCWPWGCSFPH